MEENQSTQAAQAAPCEQATKPVQPAQPVEFAPDSNLVWAILCTVLCCLPLGVVAIVKAASVDKLWMQGRKEEARMAAKAAKNYSITITSADGKQLLGSVKHPLMKDLQRLTSIPLEQRHLSRALGQLQF